MHIRNECLKCGRKTYDLDLYICPECKSTDVEEIYTCKCPNCGALVESNIDDPCPECDECVEEFDY